MAVVTGREQHLAVTTVKHLFRIRESPKLCGTAFFSNLTRKRNHPKKANGLFVQLGNNKKSKPLNTTLVQSDVSSLQYVLSTKEMRIAQFLIDELRANPKFIFNEIWKHPKRKFINIVEVTKSLKFLQSRGFSKEVIADSAAVCFYPQENIKQGLKEIKRNEFELSKIGFVNGFMEKNSCVFPRGCASKDKRLQLCIYYMELPFAFSGSGIFHSV